VSSGKGVVLVTSDALALEAQALLDSYELIYTGGKPTEDELVALCEKHQPVAILARFGRITSRVMDASRHLRVISKHGVGIDAIDVVAAKERGIQVAAARGANAATVAEHAWALILACAKSVPQLSARMHEGHWDKATHKSLELSGRTLGLIGVGSIGARVATIGIAMNMDVVAYDPHVEPAPGDAELCTLADVLRRTDVLSLHCPLTEETSGVINREALTAMRPGAIFVNTARGGLVDEPALVEALRSGKLHAAALDTFEQEPLAPDHHLRGVPNLIMTPHVAGVSTAAYANVGTAAAKNVLAALS
jgi:D-3-phosphoglycerate dehydrogenase / 2-oxoglutarate reductase